MRRCLSPLNRDSPSNTDVEGVDDADFGLIVFVGVWQLSVSDVLACLYTTTVTVWQGVTTC